MNNTKLLDEALLMVLLMNTTEDELKANTYWLMLGGNGYQMFFDPLLNSWNIIKAFTTDGNKQVNLTGKAMMIDEEDMKLFMALKTEQHNQNNMNLPTLGR